MAANSTAVPKPYVAFQTNKWDGNDGNWSSFRISVGESSQNFRVLVSTCGPALWVPIPEACLPDDQSCPSLRGVEGFKSGFLSSQSGTWKQIGIFSLDLETNLGIQHEGMYGFDGARLGFSQDKDALELDKTQVVGIAAEDCWMGIIGMSNAESTFSSQDQSVKSLIQTLKDSEKIPSLSYGYTAGAYYRYKKVPGSLVIGGYDQSRFKSPTYSFTFAESLDRFLVVGIQSIWTSFSFKTPSDVNLAASSGHLSAIDSSVSHLWLPGDVCDNFAYAFDLTYDKDTNYYLINDTTHKKLLDANPTFTFTLGDSDDTSADNNTTIELPYAAFDLFISPPAYPNTTRYFPIRRAANDSQYTIGRAFLQEAYLVVDYEHKNFSLAQANFSDPLPPRDIQTIFPDGYVFPTPPSSLSSGATTGIAIGVIAGLLLLAGALYLCWYRPRRTEQVRRQREASIVSAAPPYMENAIPPNYAEGKPYGPYYATGGQEQPASEMPASTEHQTVRPELEGGGGSYELSALTGAREMPVHEMDAGNADAAGGEGGGEEERERRASAAVGPTEG